MRSRDRYELIKYNPTQITTKLVVGRHPRKLASSGMRTTSGGRCEEFARRQYICWDRSMPDKFYQQGVFRRRRVFGEVLAPFPIFLLHRRIDPALHKIGDGIKLTVGAVANPIPPFNQDTREFEWPVAHQFNERFRCGGGDCGLPQADQGSAEIWKMKCW